MTENKKPCKPCSQKTASIQPLQARQFYPGLDMLDNALTIAYTEVPEVHRENIELMRQLVQKMRKESLRPQEAQYGALMFVLDKKVWPYITCPYCLRSAKAFSNASVLHMVEFEKYKQTGKKIHLWHSLKVLTWNIVLGYFWMLIASYHRLFKPWFDRRFKK